MQAYNEHVFSRAWHLIIGSPLPTWEMAHKRLNKIRALAAFSPDALSSIAYANQEIFLGLVVAGSAGLVYSFPIALTIAILLGIVALSYHQTIHGYPSGGGSYVVSRHNLGELPGLVAGGALMIDYVLTAAVSLTAGVEAIASAVPELWEYRAEGALILLVVITLINLRGVQESGSAMSVPVYLFLFTFIGMLFFGFTRALFEGPGTFDSTAPAAIQPLAIFLVLHAFASGSTALTGIEAISNGVPAFKPPEARNAGRTLIVMAVLMGFLFVGSIGLTQYFGVVAGHQETILSALARRILGDGVGYYTVQISTLLILAVAANTSFSGFPRLASIMAQDGFLPRQLYNLGDRLVYSNAMLLLAAMTGVLILAFKGDSHSLVPLFAVGAFLAFTMSQTGMVVHWLRQRGAGWRLKGAINGLGALTTATTLAVVAFAKFLDGAWFTLVLIPCLMYIFIKIKSHYADAAQELTLRGLPPSLRPAPPLRLVMPISGVNRAVIDAVNYARAISNRLTVVYIEVEPGSGETMQKKWKEWFPDLPLVVVPSPYRSIIGPLLEFLDRYDAECHDGQLAAVVLPEIVPAKTWQAVLHNQSAWLIKAALLYRRRLHGFQRVIIDVPFHLKR